MGHSVTGPGRFFSQHRGAFALSLLGAGAALTVFATRAAKSRGFRRVGWIILAALEASIFMGIVVVREEAHRTAAST